MANKKAGIMPSKATQDPYLRFGAAVLNRAYQDYQRGKATDALDALVWLAFDETPALILHFLEFGVTDPLEGVSRITRKTRRKIK